MSDLITEMHRLDKRLGQTEVREVAGLALVYTQRILNPFPLASSGTAAGDFGMPQALTVIVWQATVQVAAPNDGTNYWSIILLDDNATFVATLKTDSGVTAGVFTRLSTTTIANQPASGNARLGVRATATGSPGAISIMPRVIALPA